MKETCEWDREHERKSDIFHMVPIIQSKDPNKLGVADSSRELEMGVTLAWALPLAGTGLVY